MLSPDRIGRITGSRIAAVLGESPYKTRDEVMREMVRQHFGAAEEFTGNAATDYGTLMEPVALAMYEEMECIMTHGGQDFIVHPFHDFLGVSPDGLVGDVGMVECKAPYRGDYIYLDDVPYYRPQVLLQLECSGRDWCDFVVLQRDGRLHAQRVERDPDWLAGVLPQLVAFIDEYRAIIADPEAAAPHLADKDRSDAAWLEAAEAYQSAKAAADWASAALEAAKAALIELAGESGAKGCGVQVIRCERKGAVQYAKAIKDLAPDADLSAYTAAASVYYAVR